MAAGNSTTFNLFSGHHAWSLSRRLAEYRGRLYPKEKKGQCAINERIDDECVGSDLIAAIVVHPKCE